jgi:hypothetical protein
MRAAVLVSAMLHDSGSTEISPRTRPQSHAGRLLPDQLLLKLNVNLFHNTCSTNLMLSQAAAALYSTFTGYIRLQQHCCASNIGADNATFTTCRSPSTTQQHASKRSADLQQSVAVLQL